MARSASAAAAGTIGAPSRAVYHPGVLPSGRVKYFGLTCVLQLLLAANVAFGQAGAAAQTNDPVRVREARALFERGLEFMEAEQWEQAAKRFRQGLEIRPSDVVAYNLASALVHMGRLGEAVGLLRPLADSASVPEVE